MYSDALIYLCIEHVIFFARNNLILLCMQANTFLDITYLINNSIRRGI